MQATADMVQPVLAVGAGLQVVRFPAGQRQSVTQQFQRVQGDGVGEGIAVSGIEAFHGSGDGGHAGGGGEFRCGVDGETGVENHGVRNEQVVPEEHFDAAFGISHAGGGEGFAAGAGGGGDGDVRDGAAGEEATRHAGFRVADGELGEVFAGGHEERDGFAGVDGAASADTDKCVRATVAHESEEVAQIGQRCVGADAIPYAGEARAECCADGGKDVAGGDGLAA